MTDFRRLLGDAPHEEPPIRVLVVDDNELNRRVMKAILPEFHCTASYAATGDEGVALARLMEFDLVIMDFHLDETTGDQAAARIREQGPSRLAYMVRWSSDPPARLDLGLYDAELPKPVRCEAVAEAVAEAWRRALNRADARASRRRVQRQTHRQP